MDETRVTDEGGGQIEQVTSSGDSIGARLRAERERHGLSREEIADRTKIPERHLISIEDGAYAALPAKTYAVGFVRSYARVLGMDEHAAADAVRNEMSAAVPEQAPRRADHLEPGDPARIPSMRLAWVMAAAVIAILGAGFLLWRSYFLPAAELPPLAAPRETAVAAPPATPVENGSAQDGAAAEGPVTFTATVDGIWVKFYDGTGRQLFQKQMALNESFTVPADADRPQLWTGRPDALRITIGDRQVAPLSSNVSVVRDVPVDAASLAARPPGPGLPTAPTSAGSPGPAANTRP